MKLERVIELRRAIHREPELAGQEVETARKVLTFFGSLNPDSTFEKLGGHGLAFVFGDKPGPTVLLRCELDAVPVEETNQTPYRSTRAGVSHKCGHDGHMAILASVGEALSRQRPQKGRVVLLFQPAEETGAGAAAVVQDPRFIEIKPDFAFALHNLPGSPLGQIVVRPGAFACASRGIAIELNGKPTHAAQPETGSSPALALSQLIHGLSNLPPEIAVPEEIAFATVVGATLGEKAFGTAPGQAELWATLRSETNDTMSKLMDHAEQLVQRHAGSHRLDYSIRYEDVFSATVNSQRAVDLVIEAAGQLKVHVPDTPLRWSEDFGRFTEIAEGALFGIGSGPIPDLHNPDYDFPEQLIPTAANLFARLIQCCLA